MRLQIKPSSLRIIFFVILPLSRFGLIPSIAHKTNWLRKWLTFSPGVTMSFDHIRCLQNIVSIIKECPYLLRRI